MPPCWHQAAQAGAFRMEAHALAIGRDVEVQGDDSAGSGGGLVC